MRASDADRDQVVSRLHAAATEGRLAADELEDRVSAALRARTYGELDAIVADLPSAAPSQARPRASRRHRSPARRAAAGWALALVRSHPLALLVVMPMVLAAAAMLLAATVVWAVLTVVAMVLGGGRGCRPAIRGAWIYTQYRRAYGPPRRRPRSYWA